MRVVDQKHNYQLEWPYIDSRSTPSGIMNIVLNMLGLATCCTRFEVLCYCYLIQNSQAVKKVCGPQKGYGEKRCEIQGGGQEMAVMVG